ncbi:carboxypeptidase regulatory-like domain-containing protein [Novipirellula artificiosorum]|uniref:Nickel uptake substrate-specific transmembrane region n=1 Tax=Novipirellula artificiosorum TaxID=2528016 RepID=A0A5C6E0U4_9BACT|nr:carboxypeptidase regulatory-like domain-containing protein [Novipirellula artificiosorum]TWU42124.1 Nickel uptake substrate-specific transmembrane region [Novipirellula artificiosorum]
MNPLLLLRAVFVAFFLGSVGFDLAVSRSFAEEQSEEPIEITGKVLTAKGEAAVGATIRLTMRQSMLDESCTADDEGNFAIVASVQRKLLPSLWIRSESFDGQQLGFDSLPSDGQQVNTQGLEIQLGDTKTGRVSVVDSDGNPVENASFAVQLGYPTTLTEMATDATGMITFRYPEASRIEAIVAWKKDFGLDYRVYRLPRAQRADALADVPEFPTDEGETLSLDGATPFRIRAVDDAGHPISAIRFYPWLLQKDPQGEHLNLSYFADEFSETTDEDGEVEFQWMPAWQKSAVTVWPMSEEFVHTRGSYDPMSGQGLLEMKLDRLVPLRGQVTNGEGNPVAGITVAVAGKGYSMDSVRRTTTTDELGNYELLVPPEMIYLVVVKDDQWASSPQDGFAVRANQPVENKNFELRKATRVFGKLTETGTGEPIPTQRIYVYQYGADLPSLEGVELANPEKSRYWVQPMQVYSTMTDEKGAFEFSLGNGSFDIRPPQQGKAEKFEIDGEPELQWNLATVLPQEVELTGIVVKDEDEKPVGSANLEGVPQDFGSSDWRATTTENGTFRVMRKKESTYVHVRNPGRTLAAIAIVKPEDREVEIRVKPTGTVRGRLLSPETQEPWPGQKLAYGIDVPDEGNRTWSTRFGGSVVTDEKGNFEIKGLVGGLDYSVNLGTTDEGRYHTLPNFAVEPGESKDLGDVQAPPPPRPYVPPTLEERIAKAFEVEGTPTERYAKALRSIKLVKQHLLIVFGKPEDPRIHRLMEIRYQDKDFYSVRDEFRFMAIPTDQERLETARTLAKQIGEPIIGDRGNFFLVLFNSDAEKVDQTEGSELCVADELSKEKLIDWLRSHQTEMPDARTVLDNALKQAKEHDKRVIVQETATWCGPCHMLSRFLEDNRVWETDYILVKMDHRLPGARDVMKEIRDGADGGIPWYAILDASGTKLVTSNEPDDGQNIGYPSSKTGQAHFANMLNQTRQRMSEEQVKQLVSKLSRDDNP